MIRRFFQLGILSFLFLLALPTSHAQVVAPVAAYYFDNQDLTEQTGTFNSGSSTGQVDYICGVGESSQALNFTGSPDTITLDPAIKDVFGSDFTLSFNFWIEPSNTTYTLFSIKNECNSDSSLTIRYLSSINELRVDYLFNRAEFVSYSEKVNLENCWHHLIFTREDKKYSLYLDGVFIGTQNLLFDVLMGEDHLIRVGTPDCTGALDGPMLGRIDDIEIFDTAFTEISDISSLMQFSDELLTQDTTIFEGDFVDIRSGGTCAPSISWSPTMDVDDPDIAETRLSPTNTIQYFVEYDHGNCVSRDSITVSVVLTSDINCGNLLLPSAFTPNGDQLNDLYGVSNVFIVDELTRFEIFNKWGMKIYEGFNKESKWDGTYKNEKVLPGTYVYKIEYTCKGDIFKKTGSFNLLK